ncbi:glycosyltransferase [Modicisalibacter coralii]|uniref:glycosyltransferase n=1 Tax=Modicisalibacter coralii TaxID=2304602 RepID=UPI0013969192|nr:glycosyltransferase [Halomonas coralii]
MQHALFITDHLGGGGAPQSILALTRALTQQGVAVTLVVLSDKVWHAVPEGVAVHCLPLAPRWPWDRWRRYRLHARQLDALVERLDLAHADLVVANLYYSHQVVVRSSLADRAWLCIRSDRASHLAAGEDRKTRRRRRDLVRLYHRRRVIAISRGLLDSLRRAGVEPAETRVIHNGIDIETIRARMREAVDYRDYLVFVGRLVRKSKRYDRLLRAYRASGVTQRLLMIGDGDTTDVRREIEALGLEERVVLLGQLDNPYPYMHHARLLVLSSDYEGFGRVIAEALACDTPVVSTDCPSGPREILTGGLARGLVPMHDEAALARAIGELVADPPPIHEADYRRFDPAAIAEQYRALPG